MIVPRRSGWFTLAALSLAALCASFEPMRPPEAQALCSGSSLESDVVYARTIFAGTVDSIEPICTPGRIATRYRFRDVSFAKGGPAETCSLVEHQGTCGDRSTWAEHSHTFEKGARYIVFESESEAMLCSMSPFGVWSDSGTSEPTVHMGGSPLVAV